MNQTQCSGGSFKFLFPISKSLYQLAVLKDQVL